MPLTSRRQYREDKQMQTLGMYNNRCLHNLQDGNKTPFKFYIHYILTSLVVILKLIHFISEILKTMKRSHLNELLINYSLSYINSHQGTVKIKCTYAFPVQRHRLEGERLFRLYKISLENLFPRFVSDRSQITILPYLILVKEPILT